MSKVLVWRFRKNSLDQHALARNRKSSHKQIENRDKVFLLRWGISRVGKTIQKVLNPLQPIREHICHLFRAPPETWQIEADLCSTTSYILRNRFKWSELPRATIKTSTFLTERPPRENCHESSCWMRCDSSSRTTQNLSLPSKCFGVKFSRFHEPIRGWEKCLENFSTSSSAIMCAFSMFFELRLRQYKSKRNQPMQRAKYFKKCFQL